MSKQVPINHEIKINPCVGSSYVNLTEDGKRICSLDFKALLFILDNAKALEDQVPELEDAVFESKERGKAVEAILKAQGLDKKANPQSFREAKRAMMGVTKSEPAVNAEYLAEYQARAKTMGDLRRRFG